MKKTMKNRKLTVIALFVLGAWNYSYAQNSAIETVAMMMQQDTMVHEDNVRAVEQIEKAAENPKTSNLAKMWYYRGRLYLSIQMSKDEEMKKAIGDPLNLAYESLLNVEKGEKADRYTDDSRPLLLQTAYQLYNEAYAASQSGENKKAIENYMKIIKIIPYDENGDLMRQANISVETMYQYSYYLEMNSGNYAEANKYIKKLVDLNFMDPIMYAHMSQNYLNLKDTASALDALKQGKTLFETNMDLINSELDLYLKMGKTEELIAQSNLAIEQDPNNKIYYFVRGVSYDKLGEKEKAIEDYKKAVELDPYYYDGYYNLGAAYINQTEDIIKKMNDRNISFTQKEYDALAVKVDELYIKALPYFEKALEVAGDDYNEKIELAKTMKGLYQRLVANYPDYMGKYKEIKEKIKAWEESAVKE